MDINEIRYKNYQQLFNDFRAAVRSSDPSAPEKGMLQLFAQKVGIPVGYMSHINTKYKNIGTPSARKMETAFDLPRAWMDTLHTGKVRHDAERIEQSMPSAPSVEVQDKGEAEFIEAAVKLYREDPVTAQAALMKILLSKLKP